jgi:TnpA family transposase
MFPNAGKLLTGTVDVGLIRSRWDEMLHLAASLKYGHATASLVVGKLHASSRRSAIAQAMVEFGGLQRTIYALRYLADEAYRRRITRQLNKGESLHSLRRDLFFAHEGSVRRRHQEQQTEQALCLSLVVNAIITWNTAYLELALEHLDCRDQSLPRVGLQLPDRCQEVCRASTASRPICAADDSASYGPRRGPARCAAG